LSTQISINDVGSAAEFLAAIEGTIKNFNDGDLVSGIVVQVDREGEIEGKKERDEVVTGTVIEVVKGGLIVDIGLRGFLPAS